MCTPTESCPPPHFFPEPQPSPRPQHLIFNHRGIPKCSLWASQPQVSHKEHKGSQASISLQRPSDSSSALSSCLPQGLRTCCSSYLDAPLSPAPHCSPSQILLLFWKPLKATSSKRLSQTTQITVGFPIILYQQHPDHLFLGTAHNLKSFG